MRSLFLPRQGLTELFFERPKSPEPVRLYKLIKFNTSLGFVVSLWTSDCPEMVHTSQGTAQLER